MALNGHIGKDFYVREINKNVLGDNGCVFLTKIHKVVFMRDLNSDSTKDDRQNEYQLSYDDFGNLVTHIISETGTEKESKWNEYVSYDLPRPTANVEADEYIPFSIDLKPLGIDENLNDFARRKAVKPMDIPSFPREYLFYSESNDLDEGRLELINMCSKKIGEVENLCGVKKGELVKKIYIIDENDVNASFSLSDTLVLNFKKGLFYAEEDVMDRKMDHGTVSSHEAWHLIGRLYRLDLDTNWVDRYKEIKELVKETKRDSNFFAFLNEENFDLDNKIFGGHSEDNPQELFASFINSLIRENWEQIILKKDANFIENYKNTLNILIRILEEKKMDKIPLYRLAEKRISWLEGHLDLSER